MSAKDERGGNHRGWVVRFLTSEEREKKSDREEADGVMVGGEEMLQRLEAVEKATLENKKLLMEILEIAKDTQALITAGYGPGKAPA